MSVGMDSDTIREQWEAELPAYRDYCLEVERVVRKVIADAGIDTERITSRVKEVESLVRKLPLHGYTSYDEVRDKAGVRIVVRLPRDVDAALEALAPALQCDASDIDDKRRIVDPEPDRFTYRAVHIQAHGLPNGTNPEKECEIQIRTVCEDAWATMSHFLQYKSSADLPIEVRRAHAALSAIFEMADREYERQYETMYGSEDVGIVGVLRRLAPEFVRLTGGVEYSPEVSESVIETILPAWGAIPPSQISENVLRCAADRGEALRTVYADSGKRTDRSAYLLQPESLMVFERLTDGAGADVLELWTQRLPVRELERLAADFQLSLD